MPSRRAVFHLAVAALFALVAGAAAAEESTTIGTVTRVHGRAEATVGAQVRELVPGSAVARGESLRTGPDARLEVHFSDGSELTLGGDSGMVIDEFRFAADEKSGVALFRLTEGAFLMRTGAVGRLPGHPLTVKTPLASIGIRGTRFWGGPMDAPFNVLLLDGAVTVSTAHGSVDLNAIGNGTSITAADALPSTPVAWGGDRIARAVATVSFVQ
jgi:hypothetical protein